MSLHVILEYGREGIYGRLMAELTAGFKIMTKWWLFQQNLKVVSSEHSDIDESEGVKF